MNLSNRRRQHPNTKWRLQAFDLRAGLAFATYREAQSASQELGNWPCLFYAPPDFSAEPIDNVAAALAATRGSFDSALFAGNQEAVFDTPEEVAEFLRRAYVSSAGGDGADGAAGEGEPSPSPPEPRDLPPLEQAMERDRKPAPMCRDAVRKAVDEFARQIASTSFGASFEARWKDILAGDTVDSLAHGALQVLHELVRRVPAGHETHILRWLDDLRALGVCITSLNLWAHLSSGGFGETFFGLLAQIGRLTGWPWLRPVDIPDLAYLLFSIGAPLDELNDEAQYWLRRTNGRMGLRQPVALGGSDAMELLARLPVPYSSKPLIASDLGDRAGLQHLLATVVASPQSVAQKLQSIDAMATIDLVLFIAACLASSVSPAASYAFNAWPLRHVSPMQRQVMQRAGQAGLIWLAEHLPARGFSPDLEAHIFESRHIRYRGKEDHLTPGAALL